MTASANVELVRSTCAPWATGDFGDPASWAAPDIEWVMADGPAPGQWTGLDGMATSFRDFLGAWDEYRIEVDEYRSLDEYRVLVLQHFGGRGKTSGLELEGMRAQGAHLFHIHGGKVTRLVNYIDRQRALTELGLTPHAG